MTYLVFYAVIIKFPFSFFLFTQQARGLHPVFPSKRLVQRPSQLQEMVKVHVLVHMHSNCPLFAEKKRDMKTHQKVSHDWASVVASGRHRFSQTSAQLLKNTWLRIFDVSDPKCHLSPSLAVAMATRPSVTSDDSFTNLITLDIYIAPSGGVGWRLFSTFRVWSKPPPPPLHHSLRHHAAQRAQASILHVVTGVRAIAWHCFHNSCQLRVLFNCTVQ